MATHPVEVDGDTLRIVWPVRSRVVELLDARPLLVTPDDPERFVQALRG